MARQIFYQLLYLFSIIFLCSSTEDDQLHKALDIKNRLLRMSQHDAKRCSKANWATDYASFHNTVLKNDNAKILVAVPFVSGMADRIVGFATTFLISVLTARAFQMGRRGEVPPFEFAFDSPHINWQRPSDPAWLLGPLDQHATIRTYNQSVMKSSKYCAINAINDESIYNNFLQDDCPYLHLAHCDTILSVSNRGRTIHMFENPVYAKRLKEMELNPYTAFGCIVNYLLQPKPEIFLPLYNQFEVMTRLDPSVLKISIQIRAGDHIFAAESSEYNNIVDAQHMLQHYGVFFSCAAQIEEFVLRDKPRRYSSVLWYLATESRTIRRAAVQLYGDKVVTSLHSALEHSSKENLVCGDLNGGAGLNEQQCRTVSKEGFTTAAAEWWMLGYADYHVITRSSGYGRSGAYRTLAQETIYTIDKHALTQDCSKDSFTPLEDLMFDWSGI